MPGELTRDFLERVAKKSGWELNQLDSLTLQKEGILSLGCCLQYCSSLVHLDLSRNMLTSLKGIENAFLLEELLLFYNKISDQAEIQRLKQLEQLCILDLRLNPITAQEGYRSYVLQELPKLERLDDHAVMQVQRTSTRKARLSANSLVLSSQGSFQTLFESDQAFDESSIFQEESQHNFIKSDMEKEALEALAEFEAKMQEMEALSSTVSSQRGSLESKLSLVQEELDDEEDNEEEERVQNVLPTAFLETPKNKLEELSMAYSESVVRSMKSPSIEAVPIKVGIIQAPVDTKQGNATPFAQQTYEDGRVDYLEEMLGRVLAENKEIQKQTTKILKNQDQLHSKVKDVIKSVTSVVVMLKQSHEALMVSNEALLSQLNTLKQQYHNDAFRWKQNYDSLKHHYENLQHNTAQHDPNSPDLLSRPSCNNEFETEEFGVCSFDLKSSTSQTEQENAFTQM